MLKLATQGRDEVSISLGASFIKDPSAAPLELASGARLSFGVTLRENGPRALVVAYTFRYYSPSGSAPQFLRFDLNQRAHHDPLREPRCHLHPSLDGVRLPLPVPDPFEILDRIFFVIEPALTSK